MEQFQRKAFLFKIHGAFVIIVFIPFQSIEKHYTYKSVAFKNAFINNDKLLKHVFLSGIRN
ncbi:hypothetical protein C2R47_04270 [Helicobacter pylori]|nr:hypothetical protein C2R47_04270 [Helicobacter pylori]